MNHLHDIAVREFHVSRRARDRYGLSDTLFSLTGNVVLADFRAARELAHRINSGRDLMRFPDRAIGAGELNAMGLIDEVLHLVVADYRRNNPGVMARALDRLERSLGDEALAVLLTAFVTEFPPTPVYRGELTVTDYLGGATGGVSHREVAIEELLLLWLANSNPAFTPFRELFDDTELRHRTAYLQTVDRLRDFFADQPTIGDQGQSLFEELQRPMRAAPHSLQGQLDFIRSAWAGLIGPALTRLLSSLDFLAEESRPWFGPGPGPVELPTFVGVDDEPEAYSRDLDWMPRVVLLAKNAYVWLDQLSAAYHLPITTLDKIPDEELERLAKWGFTGIWLIGVWERSRASARIKRMMGDHEAVASAYSLLDYRIADDLGGEAAFLELKGRARRYGIRMATDMVPNHMGIDSRWLIEHPDWFIGLDHPPFPAYSFNGPDLCHDERVGAYLEDRYWNRTDAAVVFKRVDHWTGAERYIYHGNDGTSMPWNDTAQLDYRNPEVREAVIQTILHVARLSPIIRFDAAMTLTKRHYQRLWFPEPGSGGDIPSRAEHGMTRSDFDAAMPQEFWREVVDRVAQEAPDTLLLAEAFWLLEGYFVRSLGMHRVYNSAFMNMLRDERNADYRRLISTTLEFDPRILKRYVNFMSNPDERTAVDQFGSEDKYFGVATMMATLPGMPMFGHGQIEGLAEKYGMEFRRPRWDEQQNDELVRRHERQLFPLLSRRRIFAEVDGFVLYDFERTDGSVDDNVFAYSNRFEGQRSLVVYHNRYAETEGRIRVSVAVTERGDSGTVRHGLGAALELSSQHDRYVIFRDVVSGLEYIRSCRDVHDHGLVLRLRAYELRVFLDFREVKDDASHRYRTVADRLAGDGVESIDDETAELELASVLEPLRALVAAERLQRLMDARRGGPEEPNREALLDEIEPMVGSFLEAVRGRAGGRGNGAATAGTVRRELETALRLSVGPESSPDGGESESMGDHAPRLRVPGDAPAEAEWAALIGWILVHHVGDSVGRDETYAAGHGWFDEWRLRRPLAAAYAEHGLDEMEVRRVLALVRLLLTCEKWYVAGEGLDPLSRFLDVALADSEIRAFLGINEYRGVVWFRSEAFDDMLAWLSVVAAVETGADHEVAKKVEVMVRRLANAKEKSDCRVADLLAFVRASAAARENGPP
jgi:glycosidase